MTRHLITGVAGQDGTLLARLLVDAGHEVIGTSVGRPRHDLPDSVQLETLDITDTQAFARMIERHRPDVVHHLAGLSSVSKSWHEPEQSDLVNRQAVLGILPVLTDHDVVLLLASSAEIFGSGEGAAASESTPLDPQSPYAEAKAKAHEAVAKVRGAGMRASNIVLFGHTSELQPPRFALARMCATAAQVAHGESDVVAVQNPDVRRDWGSARDHVRAFSLAAHGEPGDYVIGTGQLTRLGEVIDWALAAAGVPEARVQVTGSDRPNDHDGLVADFTRARELLGWEPRIPLRQEIKRMVRAQL